VGQYNDKGDLVNTFLSIKDAANFINRKPNTLSIAIKKGYKSNGYYWKKI
jgi:hypothetical protein